MFTFSNSQTPRISLREDHTALGYSQPDSNVIAADQTYTIDGAPAGSTIETIEARVDHAQMADGKAYGADADRVGEQFRMERFGHAAERARMLKIYNSQGLQALLNQLKQK